MTSHIIFSAIMSDETETTLEDVLADLKAARDAKFDPRTPQEREEDELWRDEQITKECNRPI